VHARTKADNAQAQLPGSCRAAAGISPLRTGRRLRHRGPLLWAGAVIVILMTGLLQATADAHVVAKLTTMPDGTSTVTFTFFHGCGRDGQTNSLKVKLPEGTSDVQARSAPAGFTATVNGTELVWTGPPIPYDQQSDFVATMRLPGKQGETVFLPTVQACVSGEDLWLEKVADPEAPNSAPRVVLTQTVEPTSVTSTSTTSAPTSTTSPTSSAPATTPGPATTSPPSPVGSSSTGSPGGIVFFIVSAVIVIGAVIIILRRPNRPGRSPQSGDQ